MRKNRREERLMLTRRYKNLKIQIISFLKQVANNFLEVIFTIRKEF